MIFLLALSPGKETMDSRTRMRLAERRAGKRERWKRNRVLKVDPCTSLLTLAPRLHLVTLAPLVRTDSESVSWVACVLHGESGEVARNIGIRRCGCSPGVFSRYTVTNIVSTGFS